MTDVATPVRARRMPPAPRARVEATPTPHHPTSEAVAASTPAPRPRLGRTTETALPPRVGPYRVVGQLGAGGVGVVYEAEDEGLSRRVAVKILRDRSPANVARFRREARSMSRVNHPNVATVYDIGEADGRGYIAMELVRGQTLRTWLHAHPAWTEIIAVLSQAGQGLVAAHDAGVIHRDFKPDNVLVGDDGRVRVVDFGLAKHHTELCEASGVHFDREVLARELADGGITRTGSLMGTPAYMAPEQFRGEGDARTDQFSFCVVLYEALYGRLPFAGETAEELFHATSRGRLRPWPKDSEVPIGIRAVLRRGLSPRPADRYPSMAALLEAMAEAQSRGDSTPKRRHRTKGTRSWRWRIIGGATGLLLALGSSALRSEAPKTSPTPRPRVTSVRDATPAPKVQTGTHVREGDRDDTVHARTVDRPRPRLRAPRPANS